MNQNVQLVVTGRVRLSYVNAFIPKPNPKDPTAPPKFSCTALVPKSDILTKQKIDAAINAAINLGVASKWSGVRPPIIPVPVHDGDAPRPSDGMPFGEECRGNWVFTASNTKAPQVVDATVAAIMTQSEIYSGIYGRVSVTFFPYFNAGKRGIGCSLNNIQKLEDGESLAGGTTAAADFGDPQQAAYPVAAQPGYPGAPAAAYPGISAPTAVYSGAQPGYPTQQPTYPTAPPATATYPVYPAAAYPATAPTRINPITGQPIAATTAAIDPITGRPIPGPIMGL